MIGERDFSFIKTESGPMLEPLKEPAYFQRVFVEDRSPDLAERV